MRPHPSRFCRLRIPFPSGKSTPPVGIPGVASASCRLLIRLLLSRVHKCYQRPPRNTHVFCRWWRIRCAQQHHFATRIPAELVCDPDRRHHYILCCQLLGHFGHRDAHCCSPFEQSPCQLRNLSLGCQIEFHFSARVELPSSCEATPRWVPKVDVSHEYLILLHTNLLHSSELSLHGM